MSLPLGPAATYGPLLLGGLFASILTGITTTQMVIYYRLYPQDNRFLKGLIFTVWFALNLVVNATRVLDLTHTTFTWRGMWYYLVENFGDETKIKLIHMSIPCTGLLTAIITIIVQCFYVDRIFRLSKRNYWITVPIFVLSITRLVASIVIVTKMFIVTTFPAFAKYGWLLTFALSLSSGVDILITVAMLYFLRESRTRTLTLHNSIDQLVLCTLEVGTLTSLGAILAMLCWTAISNKLIFLGSLYPVGKLYANSILAVVNARYQLRQPGESRPSQVRHSENAHFVGLARSVDGRPLSFDMQRVKNGQKSIHSDDKVETGSSTSKVKM